MRLRRPAPSDAVRERRLQLLEAHPLLAPPRSRAPLPPSNVIALQRASGNRGVGALLRRQPRGATPADARKHPAVRATIIMDDPIGVIPLLSFSRGQTSEIVVTVPSTSLDTVLMRHMAQGIVLKHVTISTTGFDLELADVMIMSFARTGPEDDAVVVMTLSFASERLK